MLPKKHVHFSLGQMIFHVLSWSLSGCISAIFGQKCPNFGMDGPETILVHFFYYLAGVSGSTSAAAKSGAGSSSIGSNSSSKSRYLMTTIRRDSDDSDSDETEISINKTKQDTDDDDDDDEEDENEDVEPEIEKKSMPIVKSKAVAVRQTRKRGRGRPPKNLKSKKLSSPVAPGAYASGDTKSSADPYDFDADDAGSSQLRSNSSLKTKENNGEALVEKNLRMTMKTLMTILLLPNAMT